MLPASSARDVMSPPRYAATTEKVSAMLQQHNPPTQQQSPVIQQQQEQRPVQEQRPHGLQRPEPTLEQIQRVIDMQAREEALAQAKVGKLISLSLGFCYPNQGESGHFAISCIQFSKLAEF